MTTNVPRVYAFHELKDVAGAVADYVVHAQTAALNKDVNLTNQILTRDNSGKNITEVNGNLSGSSSVLSNTPESSGKYTHKRNHSRHRSKKLSVEPRFKIALSGGSLVQVLHDGLLTRTDIQWGKWDIFFADERLVPFESEESNFGQVKRKILDHIDIAKYGKPNVYHINETLIGSPQECADNYEKQLIKNFARRDSVKLPMFDLFLLGCAPDGHIASLFPNFQDNLREKYAWCIAVENAPSGPSSRISLTVPVICHSHRLAFVVEGSTKAPILKTIMERPEKGLPSSIVNEGAAGRVSWFVDDDALNDVFITKKKYKYRHPVPAMNE
ncbi:hypothetical protein KAFR_0F04330 [Kazachstania africana CBS 2517]|uniref:6-phosphogluconolactonase-like protein n=1 Tax=Kazachstania africana (strain ATCC 22294 / BCRC 22015 / CBS 2517 / CECT 1963 / NBRC 1671 / NRRL Y-8276) TaxID=1071382 RepID=H2AXC8_KAZAF|nr:hypothetical protein KAFR_0F04330 [Kazachstania africana CBS 2517]CCF59028.1 hypothetical protein KAFR_0F04330 [Kazachstania africana CBS 2517]